MINSKQRAWLRSQANPLDSLFQIGKGEMSDQLVRSLDEILSTHELLKINVLKTAEQTPAELARQLAESADADVVQVIGRRIVLYRHSEKLAKAGKAIQLP
ncbi:MAG TPA: ribosome assembly RNA-binding protein YhbY [Clostridiales bacterium]|nr:ribosome assembly RNA-binding protein YhbY [Clostridiales bacterium]